MPGPCLAEAVAELIEPRKVTLDRLTDGGTIITERITVDSLLDDLSAAAGSTVGGGGRVRGRATGSPVDLGALDLLDAIRVRVADTLDLAGLGPEVRLLCGYDQTGYGSRRRREPHVERSLRQLVAHSWHDDQDSRDSLARTVRGWAKAIRALLDGERDYREVRGIVCPRCLMGTVWRQEAGELVRGWPLVVDLRDGWVRGITCQSCGTYWWRSREDLTELAAELGLDVDRVLAALQSYEVIEAAGRVA